MSVKIRKSYLIIILFLVVAIDSSLGQWKQVVGPPVPTMVNSIFASGSTLFASVESEGFFRSMDSGNSWNRISLGSDANPPRSVQIEFNTESNGQLFSAYMYSLSANAVSRSQNQGATWTRVLNDSLSFSHLTGFKGNFKSLFRATTGGLYRSLDSGITWRLAMNGIPEYNSRLNEPAQIYRMELQETTLVVSAVSAYLRGHYLSTNNGDSWILLKSGLPEFSYPLAMAVLDSTLFLAFDEGLFRSSDYGASWARIENGLADGRTNSLVRQGDAVFAGTDKGLFVSSDHGNSWHLIPLGTTITGVKTVAVSGPVIYAGLEDGVVFRSSDDGVTWRKTMAFTTKVAALTSVATKDSLLFVTADGMGIMRSADNGTSWKPVNDGLTSTTIRSIASLNTDLFATASGDGLFRSANHGDSWTHSDSGLSGSQVLFLFQSAHGLFTGTDSGLFRSQDDGKSWTPAMDGMPATIVRSIAEIEGTLIAGTQAGMFLSANNGDSWAQLESSFYEGGTIGGGVINSIVAANNSFFAAPDHGGIYRSIDRGSTWTSLSIGENGGDYSFEAYSLLVVKNGILFAGSDRVGLFISADLGNDWDGINLWQSTGITSVAMNDYGLFYSDRGRRVWMRSLSELGLSKPISVQRLSESGFSIESGRFMRPGSKFGFKLNHRAYVDLSAYDSKGRKAANLLNAKLEPGAHQAVITGEGFSEGIYFLRLQVDGLVYTHRIVFAN